MDLKLNGKRALVSGSTAGIGLAIAEGLAAEGASVVINGRTQKRVDAAIALIKANQNSADVTGIAADVSTAAGADALIKAVPAVDILINNAGIFEPKSFPDIPDADWTRFFETNVMSGVRLTRGLLPGMVKKQWGRVIFISSESGLNIPPEMIHYGVTKTAQIALARGIAESVAGSGVTVNSVLPGPTLSEGVATFVEKLSVAQKKSPAQFEKEFIETMRPTSLIRRFASTAEVAAIVVYLCGELASATTGAAVRVDGGVVRSIA